MDRFEEEHDHIIKSGDGPAAVKKAVCNNHAVTFQATGFTSDQVEIEVHPTSAFRKRGSDGKYYLYFEGTARFSSGKIPFFVRGRVNKKFTNSYIDHHPQKVKITK